MDSRNVILPEFFSYILGRQSWPLTKITSSLRKTKKVLFTLKLEKRFGPITSNVDETVTIIDGMTMIQKTKKSGLTLSQLANQLFMTTPAIGSSFSRNGVVFDKENQNLIKCVESRGRGVASLVLKHFHAKQQAPEVFFLFFENRDTKTRH